MSIAVKSESILPTQDPNLPIAMRPGVRFGALRGSIFDDPGDEKSWHISQRSESLTRYFEGREPSWYASAIAPLRGAERVLDLGCGPGLTLAALLDQGCASVIGVDRWPAFTVKSTPRAPILAHDLTLPMPFLPSASFGGVLSHYALDYVSPIGMRQVLREARRVLVPDGLLLIYVAAVGMGSGDEARTAAYSPAALRILLAEAGFEEIDVEASPNGRNSVVKARRLAGEPEADTPLIAADPGKVLAMIEGDAQLTASFPGGGGAVNCALAGEGHSTSLTVDLPRGVSAEEVRTSACARALRLPSGGTELQLWVWRGDSLAAVDCARLELAASEMRLDCGAGGVEEISAWVPGDLSIEPIGNAYARFADLSSGASLSEAERGAEGRQIVIETLDDVPLETGEWLGPGRNRFLIRRASLLDVSTIEREWLEGQASGVMVTDQELAGEGLRELLLWAGWRQCLLYIGGSNWTEILAVASRRAAELRGPVVLVDPTLCGSGEGGYPPPPELAVSLAEHDHFFALLDGQSRDRADRLTIDRLSGRLLHGGQSSNDMAAMRAATETLRHLTERTLLMRLRQTHGCSWAEVGRRPPLP